MKDYKEILEVFYYKVQELMIKKGIAYAFEGMLGCIVINRCHLLKHRPMLDYQATKQREKELLAAGKKFIIKKKLNGVHVMVLNIKLKINEYLEKMNIVMKYL